MTHLSILKSTLKLHVIAFSFITAFCFLLFGGIIQSSYGLIDEVEYLKIANPDLEYYQNSSEKASEFCDFIGFHKKYLNHGRFKLVGVSLQWIWAKEFGNNPYVLKLTVLLITIFSGFGFYLVLHKLHIPFLDSLLGMCILATGYYSEIWFRLGSYEAVGFLFFIYAIYLYQYFLSSGSRRARWLSLFFIFLAIQCKETFWILLPAISLIYIGLSRYYNQSSFKEAFYETRFDIQILAMFFVLVALMLVFLYKLHDNNLYGFRSYHNTSLIFQNNIRQLLNNYTLFLPVLLLLIFSKKQTWVLYFLALMVLWYSGQCLVNIHNLINPNTRYVFPGQVLLIFIAVISCFHLYKKAKIVGYGMRLFLIFMMLIQAKNTFSNASYYQARSKVVADGFKLISTHHYSRLILVMDSYTSNEYIESTQAYLSYLGYDQSMQVSYIFPKNKVLPPEKIKEYEEEISRSESIDHLIERISSDSSNQTCYLFLNPWEELNIPISTLGLEKIMLTESYVLLSAQNLLKHQNVQEETHILMLVKK